MYFFLLVLGVPLNLTPNVIYKRGRFSKAFLKKILKLVLNRESDPVMFDPGFILLGIKVNPIPKEQGCEKDTFVTLGLNGFKIVLALSTEVVIFRI